MPVSSLFADVEVPDVDLWTLYMERPKPYPDDHRTVTSAPIEPP